MKNITMIKPTNQFQTIIDKYHTNFRRKKPKASLNSLFVKDLNTIKNFNNYSNEEEYMMNEIKNEKKVKNIKNNNKYSHLSMSNDKISKDLFFYYKNKLNDKKNNNERKGINNNNIYLRYNSASHRINSGNRSENSISSIHSRNSKRKNENSSLILPLINDRSYNYNYSRNNQNNNRYLFLEDDTNNKSIPQSEKKTEFSEEINNDGNINNQFLKHYKRCINKNEFKTIDIKDFIKNMRIEKGEKEILYKLHLPLLKNDLFNKINKVTEKSENISKNINYLYSEGNIYYENEKNKINFIKNIMNE